MTFPVISEVAPEIITIIKTMSKDIQKEIIKKDSLDDFLDSSSYETYATALASKAKSKILGVKDIDSLKLANKRLVVEAAVKEGWFDSLGENPTKEKIEEAFGVVQKLNEKVRKEYTNAIDAEHNGVEFSKPDTLKLADHERLGGGQFVDALNKEPQEKLTNADKKDLRNRIDRAGTLAGINDIPLDAGSFMVITGKVKIQVVINKLKNIDKRIEKYSSGDVKHKKKHTKLTELKNNLLDMLPEDVKNAYKNKERLPDGTPDQEVPYSVITKRYNGYIKETKRLCGELGGHVDIVDVINAIKFVLGQEGKAWGDKVDFEKVKAAIQNPPSGQKEFSVRAAGAAREGKEEGMGLVVENGVLTGTKPLVSKKALDSMTPFKVGVDRSREKDGTIVKDLIYTANRIKGDEETLLNFVDEELMRIEQETVKIIPLNLDPDAKKDIVHALNHFYEGCAKDKDTEISKLKIDDEGKITKVQEPAGVDAGKKYNKYYHLERSWQAYDEKVFEAADSLYQAMFDNKEVSLPADLLSTVMSGREVEKNYVGSPKFIEKIMEEIGTTYGHEERAHNDEKERLAQESQKPEVSRAAAGPSRG